MLPLLNDVLDQVEELKAEVRALDEKLQILDALWGQKITDRTNPDRDDFLHHKRILADRLTEINELVQKEILNAGLRFPAGGLEHGLIDFPTTFEGRWVYLCWHRGEQALGFWHELEAGFRGRQEIAAEHIIRMGKEDDPADLDSSGLDF